LKVILDTSAIIATGSNFDSTDLEVVFKSRGQLHIDVIVPQVVIEELVGKRLRELRESIGKLKEATSNVNKLSQQPLPDPVDSGYLNRQACAYRERIEGILGATGVTILGYPDVSLDEIIQRVVSRKKPIKNNGEGIGDLLLWWNVLQVRRETPLERRVIFVSRNDKDFVHKNSDAAWRLHDHLQEDLRNAGLPGNSVEVAESVADLRCNDIDPRLQRVNVVANRVIEKVAERSRSAIQEWFDNSPQVLIPPKILGIADDWTRVAELRVGEPTSYLGYTAWELPNDELLVDLVLDCRIDYSVVRCTHEQFLQQGGDLGTFQPEGAVKSGFVVRTFRVSAVVGSESDPTIASIKAQYVLVPGRDAVLPSTLNPLP
jgi:hypothetical protein